MSRRDLDRTLLVGQGESIFAGQLAANHPDDALQYLREATNRGSKDADGLMADPDLEKLRRVPQVPFFGTWVWGYSDLFSN